MKILDQPKTIRLKIMDFLSRREHSAKEIFQKPIDRPIDGVIKADDEESILNELEEYVITSEIEKMVGEGIWSAELDAG